MIENNQEALLSALRGTLHAFETCIGKAAFAEFIAANPDVIAARAAIAACEVQPHYKGSIAEVNDALLAALRRLADACEDMTLTHAARCTAIGRYARAAIAACEVQS